MKVGIVTIHNSTSYGACLQSFALWKYIVNQGIECEIIDLRRPVHDDYVVSKHFVPLRPAPAASVWYKIYCGLGRILKKKHKKSEREQKFDKFNSQIKLSKRYYSVDEVHHDPPVYDLYITGSDQVWNPLQPYCMEPYFLTFVRATKSKKISYASSFGITKLLVNEKEKFKEWLSTYDAISVRELEAKKLINSFLKEEVNVVLDPTFLLNELDWEREISLVHGEENFILLFTLNGDKKLFDYANNVAKEQNRKLIIIGGHIDTTGNAHAQYMPNVGPNGFLGLIKKAATVITDSFHGTVFSIIVGEGNFLVYIANSNQRGSRITHLLSLFQLNSFLLREDILNNYDLASQPIDRCALKDRIKVEREYSRRFLNQFLYE